MSLVPLARRTITKRAVLVKGDVATRSIAVGAVASCTVLARASVVTLLSVPLSVIWVSVTTWSSVMPPEVAYL